MTDVIVHRYCTQTAHPPDKLISSCLLRCIRIYFSITIQIFTEIRDLQQQPASKRQKFKTISERHLEWNGFRMS